MTDRVLDALCADADVDLFVLSEYCVPKRGDVIRSRLSEGGWPYALHSSTPVGKKGVAMYSRHPLQPAPQLLANWHPNGLDLTPHIVAGHLSSVDLWIVGTYVPFPDGDLKEALWHALIESALENRDIPLAIAGDFNSCHPREADSGRGYTVRPLQRMSLVATDLWRAAVKRPQIRDQITWSGPNGLGNRIDFVFGTPTLATLLITATHRHELRESKVSDHSPVVVDFRIDQKRKHSSGRKRASAI